MNRQPLFYFALVIGLIAFMLAYCASIYFHIPLPRYYPTRNQWSMVKDANYPSMGWYAQTVASLMVGCGVGGLAYRIGQSVRQSIGEHSFSCELPVGWQWLGRS